MKLLIFFVNFFSRNSRMAILGINVWYSKVVKSKKSWEIEFIIELLWFCVVDSGLVDSWNNLREILDERWLRDLSPKFLQEILRVLKPYIFIFIVFDQGFSFVILLWTL